MKKEIIDTSKYPTTKNSGKSIEKQCWIIFRKSNGAFYKEDMYFTFDSILKHYRRHLRLLKENPSSTWLRPFKDTYEVFECKITKEKQIILK